jgi:hypothetical protein
VELSNTLKYINLAGLDIGVIPWYGPMNLRTCVSEELGDGEGEGSPALSDTRRYMNLTGSVVYYESMKRKLI